MALQLAWYKSRGSFTATYETALTRAFDKARTETIRTLTEDSRAWVLSMVDPFASVRYRPFSRFLGLIEKEGFDEAHPSTPRCSDTYDPIASRGDWTWDRPAYSRTSADDAPRRWRTCEAI
jgi:hypothetical protein